MILKFKKMKWKCSEWTKWRNHLVRCAVIYSNYRGNPRGDRWVNNTHRNSDVVCTESAQRVARRTEHDWSFEGQQHVWRIWVACSLRLQSRRASTHLLFFLCLYLHGRSVSRFVTVSFLADDNERRRRGENRLATSADPSGSGSFSFASGLCKYNSRDSFGCSSNIRRCLIMNRLATARLVTALASRWRWWADNF